MNRKMYRDPVCGEEINRQKARASVRYKNYEYMFCCPLCLEEFQGDPERYAEPAVGCMAGLQKRKGGRRN